jgi:hypothetical protein
VYKFPRAFVFVTVRKGFVMLTKIGFYKLGSSCLVAAALSVSGLGGCSQPVDTSPAVTITVPTAGEVLPAGMPIDVRFTISGFDASGGGMVPFTLVGGSDMRTTGQGQVRAFLSTQNFIARTVTIPNDTTPFLIPDPTYASAAQLVTPGPKTITLHLYYNDTSATDGGTDVDPQREGTVNIMVQ